MQFFFIQLMIISSLSVTLAVAEHKWPDISEYYVYRGPPAPLGSDGRVMDTPEVAHARAAHLATHAEVSAQMGHDQRHEVWEEPDDNAENKYEEHPYDVTQTYQGPLAPLGHDGRVVDTAEGKPDDNAEQAYDVTEPYQGPLAPLGHDGRVVDTAEVANAKAAHLAAHAQAAAEASQDYDYHGSHNNLWDDRSNEPFDVTNNQPVRAAYTHHHLPVAYRGPPAPLAPDGRVLDTPEVAHAKAAHLRAHALAAALAAHREAELYY